MNRNRKYKILPTLAVATLIVAGLSSCSSSDSAAKSVQSQNGGSVVTAQSEDSGTEESAPEEEASVKSGGFLEIEMDQSEIDRLDAENAPIDLANPEAVNPALIFRDEYGVLWVRIALSSPQFREVVDEVGADAASEGKVQLGYDGAIYVQDLERWLNQDQISGLSCVAQGEAIMLTLNGYSDESLVDLHIAKVLTGETTWYVVSPSCEEQEISRRSTVSYAIHIVYLEDADS